MKIEAFIICWNEIDTIQLTINHYQRFCDKITFYDNYSNDGTAELIKENGCDLIQFGTRGILEDKEYIKVKNNCWKNSKADWVIVCDSDEIIWNNEIEGLLRVEWLNGATVFKSRGWDIYSESMPVHDFFEIKTGIVSENYSKLAVFSPKIKSINYVYGCHVADPVGGVVYAHEKLNLFHYRNIGGAQRLINRHAIYRERLSAHNKKFGLGIHYTYNDEKRKKDWIEAFNRSTEFDHSRRMELANK